MNKTGYTRTVGLLLLPGEAFALYNTRNASMKWSGLGELKAKQHLEELARMNAGVRLFNKAILFGSSGNVAIQTLTDIVKGKNSIRFDELYNHIYFVPLNRDGQRLIRLLLLPELRLKLQEVVFPREIRIQGYVHCECDAIHDGQVILSHLDGDITWLLRFGEAVAAKMDPSYEIICYPWQVGYVKALLDNSVSIRCLEMTAIENALFEKE